jgi:hypothetical protein
MDTVVAKMFKASKGLVGVEHADDSYSVLSFPKWPGGQVVREDTLEWVDGERLRNVTQNVSFEGVHWDPERFTEEGARRFMGLPPIVV